MTLAVLVIGVLLTVVVLRLEPVKRGIRDGRIYQDVPQAPRVAALAASVSIPLLEFELAAFARTVGAGPSKEIVLVLDQAGWHTSLHLRVPEHVHLLFLPAHSRELQPVEHLWILTNEALVKGVLCR